MSRYPHLPGLHCMYQTCDTYIILLNHGMVLSPYDTIKLEATKFMDMWLANWIHGGDKTSHDISIFGIAHVSNTQHKLILLATCNHGSEVGHLFSRKDLS